MNKEFKSHKNFIISDALQNFTASESNVGFPGLEKVSTVLRELICLIFNPDMA